MGLVGNAFTEQCVWGAGGRGGGGGRGDMIFGFPGFWSSVVP